MGSVYYNCDRNEQLKHKTIIEKLTQIMSDKAHQRVAAGKSQRGPTSLTSINTTAPETIRTSKRSHQRQTRSNTPMPSIIKEVVDAGGERFNLPPQRVENNSNNWRKKCLEHSREHEAKNANNHSIKSTRGIRISSNSLG